MAEPTLAERIRGLSPQALTMFKRQIQALPESEKQKTFQSLSGIPELSDITGTPQLGTLTKEKEPQFWQNALYKGTAPLRFLSGVTERFGAYATDPFTPAIKGTSKMSTAQRQLAEYRAWREPEFTMPWGGKFRPTKGVVESLPWLALPTAGAVVGKLGAIAAKGGALGTAARLGATALKPVAAVENLPNVAVGKLLNLVKVARPLRKETELLYRTQRARNAATANRLMAEALSRGATREEAETISRQALSGKLTQADLSDAFIAAKNDITPDDMDTLLGMIQDRYPKRAYDRENATVAFQEFVFGEKIPTRSQMKYLEEVFGSELIKEFLKKRTFGQKAGETVLDIANAPRALLASGDLSGVLRQGGILTVAHPLEALQTFKPMIKAAFSKKYETIMDNNIRALPYFNLAEEHGLYIAPTTSRFAVAIGEREEAFMSTFLKFTGVVPASNRAYITGLNDIRTRIWQKTLDSWTKGRKIIQDDKLIDLAKSEGMEYGSNAFKEFLAKSYVTDFDMTQLAKMINYATGRGDLPESFGMSKAGGLLNAIFFAPRLQFSRFQFPAMLFSDSALVRKETAKLIIKDLSVGVSFLGAIAMSGRGSIELDPRSSDFGKLKVGETRYDIWTGYSQYLRALAQLASGQKKTETGRLAQRNRLETVIRFLESKSSPLTGMVVDLFRGETYMGEDLPPKTAGSVLDILWERTVPLVVQDTRDAIMEDGLILGSYAGAHAFLGVSVQTYTDEVSQTKDRVAQRTHGMSWDEVSKTFGMAEQMRLAQEPEVIAAEQEKERRFGADTTSRMSQYRALEKRTEEHYRKSVQQAVELYRQNFNGVQFRDNISRAKEVRREAFSMLKTAPEFKSVIDYYKQPVSLELQSQMNPNDLARKEYYEMLFADDMTNPLTGEYDFEKADQREREFLSKYGREARDYIETYQASRWVDKPDELKLLESAQDIAKPYFDIEQQVLSMFPPEMKQAYELIKVLERTDPDRAKRETRKFPQVLRAREMIARQRKLLKRQNPQMAEVLRLYYGR